MKYVFEKTSTYKPNLFMIAKPFKEEDRLTKSWEYLLNNVREIGQSVVDYLIDNSEEVKIEKSLFKEAIDQDRFKFSIKNLPIKNKPDLVIDCQDYIIVCEHKINSPEGDNQIPRYCNELEHYEKKPLYVLLISLESYALNSMKVLDYENYLRPKNKLNYQWEDFYPIIEEYHNKNKLAEYFCKYMSLLGMRTIEFPGWGNIFNHTDAIHFKKLLESLKPYLKAKLEPKSGVRIDPSNLGLNVPMPERLPISVIHLLASKTPGHLDHRLEGIGLFIEVKTNIIHENRLNKLKKINNYFDTEIGQISVRTPEQNTANSKGFILLREYAIDLNRILDTEDFQTAKERMIKFAEESLNHLKKTISQNERL